MTSDVTDDIYTALRRNSRARVQRQTVRRASTRKRIFLFGQVKQHVQWPVELQVETMLQQLLLDVWLLDDDDDELRTAWLHGWMVE